MLVRLLQAFQTISVDLDAHPDARPPIGWANGTGRQPIEKVWLKSHLTAYANVSGFKFAYAVLCVADSLDGSERTLGSNGRGS